MTTVTATAAAASYHRLTKPLSIIASITSLLQSLNPQHPNTHQNPDPSLLNHFSPYLTPTLVIQTIKSQTSPYHSLFFFNWASCLSSNSNNYTHNHFSYIAITDKLISHKLFSLAADLLKSHDRFSDFMVGKFIKAHGDLGHLKWAVKLLHQVKEREFGCCLFSYNALLGVLVKANRVDLAWGYFGQIVKEGVVVPDVSTYTIMIKGLCKVGRLDDAWKLFDEMPLQRNMVTCNTIIDGFCKKGFVENAKIIVEEMVQSETCLPDVVTFTTLIDGYCKKGEVENAMKYFDEMVKRGSCAPNLLTYNDLINGLCLKGNLDEARRMMTRMRLSGVRDNVATCTSLLRGYCIAGRSNEAIQFFKEMVNLGMSLDGKSYAIVVNEYCKLRRPDEGFALLREMRARGINSSVASFNAVLRSLVQLQELDKAILLLRHMPRMGCIPNFLSYNVVIIGLVSAKRRMQEVDMLVNDMLQDGHGLDATLYSFLVKACCENGDINKAIWLFKEMINVKYVINLECFAVLCGELFATGRASEVENLFEQLRNVLPVSDVKYYRRILNNLLCRNGDHLCISQ
ncbi:pentatricopeptide repeat-containing At4g11690-like [Olea europaea subsp. europaea]|uniref:Pentatricopeptide repeat-containing At4g11690-like n=1 Tax=Olea europaea subsp. europaea TaxID=158383 RepID=A0A8S0SXM2_OLEEU|nr:pentatricopeptide repeat-containing At4g11690-like [Olea europaea subsp. europaea]